MQNEKDCLILSVLQNQYIHVISLTFIYGTPFQFHQLQVIDIFLLL